MRMWMVDPALLCRQHLLGEHRELHAITGIVLRNKSLNGYLAKGLIEVHNISTRHQALVAEMNLRGYCHRSPLEMPATEPLGTVDVNDSAKELRARCPACKERMDNATTSRW